MTLPNSNNTSNKASAFGSRSASTPNTANASDGANSNGNEQYNWYGKLHPIGVSPQQKRLNPKKRKSAPLNLSLFFRIWLAVALIIVLSGLIVFNQLFNYVRPVTRQVIEDTLVDTAEVLTTALQLPLETGQLYNPEYQEVLDTAFQSDNPASPPSKHRYENKQGLEQLSTWYHNKTHSSFRVYVTDSNGQVVYDSLSGSDNAEGEDYSQWHDVYRTLKGNYGARTTRQDPDDPTTSVMYVAKPIYANANSGQADSTQANTETTTVDFLNESLADSLIDKDSKLKPVKKEQELDQKQASSEIQKVLGDGKILIGVVSVGKPTATITPYLDATRQRMLMTSAIISVVALILAGLVAWWLKQSMKLVTRYTQSLAQDANKPYFFLGRELNELSDTIETMKHKLENRAYVTDYVHTLTHELKSPLTAIRASGELLEDTDLDMEDRVMLSQTITEQSIKLQALIDRLLLLAKIEQPTFRLTLEPIHIHQLMATLVRENESQRLQNNVTLTLHTQDKENSNINNSVNDNDVNDNSINDNLIVYADRFWLTQALQNIIDNALYFAKTRVDISVRSQNDWIEIAVCNDGDLIPDYALRKIFDRYFSLSHNAHNQSITRRGKKGTGLGLTLVQQVIERHEGSVKIDNVENDEVNNKTEVIDDGQSGVLVTIRLPISHQQ